MARAEGFRLNALTVRYGQRHASEVEAARAVAKWLGVARHVEVDVGLSAFGGSSLTSDAPVPKDRPIDPTEIPSTYVPARNTVFLALALGWAEVLGAHDIVIGVNALDYSGYPDCRPEFIAAFEQLASLATARGVHGERFRIHAPLQMMTKRDIVTRGIELGLDYGLTQSCYDPGAGRSLRTLRQLCASRQRFRRGWHRGSRAAPMTDRIYYTEPSCRSFEATVTRVDEREGRSVVVLDRTAFYPTSGGQPFDTGRLGAVEVIETIDGESEVVHVVSGPLPAGERVRGEIDWARRFDHMQQHTGQHVLSAAFDRLFENRTTSFHMGVEVATIDLAREAAPGEIDRALDEANHVVWEDREVSVRFVSADEAARLPLRKEPVREGTLRLVEIRDFDLSACGGTHVSRTGAIGVIAVTNAERFRGGSRITFVCGGRAARIFRSYRDAVSGAVRVLSVLPHELPGAIERAQLESKALRKTVSGLQGQLAGHEAARLFAGASVVADRRIVVQVLEGWDAAGLKTIASSLIAQDGVAAALVSASEPMAVIVARSQNLAIDAGKTLRTLLDRFGGRGGGRPELAQGAGLVGKVADVLAAARELLSA